MYCWLVPGNCTCSEYLVTVYVCLKFIICPFIEYQDAHAIIMKSLDPLRAKKIFIRKKLGHTAVAAIKASSVTL